MSKIWMFQTTGLGGEVQVGHDAEKVASLSKRPERQITVRFTSDTSSGMMWDFKPQQSQLKVILIIRCLMFLIRLMCI